MWLALERWRFGSEEAEQAGAGVDQASTHRIPRAAPSIAGVVSDLNTILPLYISPLSLRICCAPTFSLHIPHPKITQISRNFIFALHPRVSLVHIGGGRGGGMGPSDAACMRSFLCCGLLMDYAMGVVHFCNCSSPTFAIC